MPTLCNNAAQRCAQDAILTHIKNVIVLNLLFQKSLPSSLYHGHSAFLLVAAWRRFVELDQVQQRGDVVILQANQHSHSSSNEVNTCGQ